MLSFILFTLVFVWAFLVLGAGYLAWRYYTKEIPERRRSTSGSQSSPRREAPAGHRLVVPDSG